MHFFFDVVNGTSSAYDFHGKYLKSEKEAHEIAEAVSFDLACSETADHNDTAVLVRNTNGQVIFSVPGAKVETLVQGLRHFEEIKLGYTDLAMVMRPDFPQPEFYKTLFRMWGLDVQE